MTERHEEEARDDRDEQDEDLPDKSDEDPVTRREALETELMDRGESERGEEVGEEID